MSEDKPINFTIVPDVTGDETRTYANFCAIAHTPFDFTLTFCEVMPLSEKDVREAGPERIVRAPVRAQVVVSVQFVETLIGMLQEHMRIYTESSANQPWKRGPVH
jgi:hypothetical protein